MSITISPDTKALLSRLAYLIDALHKQEATPDERAEFLEKHTAAAQICSPIMEQIVESGLLLVLVPGKLCGATLGDDIDSVMVHICGMSSEGDIILSGIELQHYHKDSPSEGCNGKQCGRPIVPFLLQT